MNIESVLQLISALANVYFVIVLRSIQSRGESTKFWREQAEEKDVIITRISAKKDIYKNQYQLLKSEHDKLLGHHDSCYLQTNQKKVYDQASNQL